MIHVIDLKQRDISILQGARLPQAAVGWLCVYVFLTGCARTPAPAPLPAASPVLAPQHGLKVETLSGRSRQFSILVDDGRAISDPSSIAYRNSVVEATKFIEVRSYAEKVTLYEENRTAPSNARLPSGVGGDHLLFVDNPFDVYTPASIIMLAFYDVVENSTRRITEVNSLEERYRLSREAIQRLDLTGLKSDVRRYFISSSLGVPVPLKNGDVIAYLDLTVVPVLRGVSIDDEPAVWPAAVRVIGEQRLFAGLKCSVDCWVATAGLPDFSGTVTAYITKDDGIVVKSIIVNNKARWRVIKTMYPDQLGGFR